MEKKPEISSILLMISLLVLFYSVVVSAIEDDIMCLQVVKKTLDPQNKLNWNLNNNSAGAICQLNGVTCWDERENRIINLQLPDFQLVGQLPESLKYCKSLQSLDLSKNALSGSLPPQICNWLPFVVTLDLSSNSLTGSIPPEIVNCKFLNNLILNDNKLSGSIPYGLGRLDRLKKFSVVNNDLSGSIPADLATFPVGDFEGNRKLRGRPLDRGGLSSKTKSIGIIIAAGVAGATASIVLGFAIWWWLGTRESNLKMRSSSHG